MKALVLDDLTAGDTWDFTTIVEGYPATDGWVLNYYLTPYTTGIQVVLTATTAADGTSYRIQKSPVESALIAAGDYTWTARVEKAGSEITVSQGLVTIEPQVAGRTSFDGRSSARRIFEAIEAVIEGRASRDQEEYTIAGANGSRQLKRTPIADLLVLRDRYKAEVESEENAAAIASGLSNPRVFGVRFNRV